MNLPIEDSSGNQSKIDSQDQDQYKFKLLKDHFRREFRYSYLYIVRDFLYSIAKSLVFFYGLSYRNKKADVNPLIMWIAFVGIYEFFYSMWNFAVLYTLSKNSRDIFILVLAALLKTEPLHFRDIQDSQKRAQIKTLIKMKLPTQEISRPEFIKTQFNYKDIIHYAEVFSKSTRIKEMYDESIYILILLAGLATFFLSYTYEKCDDDQLCKIGSNIIRIEIICIRLLYVQTGITVLSLILWSPLFLLIYLIDLPIKKIYNKIQTKRIQNRINKMSIQYYNNSIETTILECNICLLEYVENDKIIQLPCSNMHHFHEKCLEAWLKIKQKCPICSKSI